MAVILALGPQPVGAVTNAPSPGAGWTTYHYDNSRQGADPSAPAFGGRAVLSWSKTGLDGAVFAEPLVYQGRVYIATMNDSVYAFDEVTGAQLWYRHLATPHSGYCAFGVQVGILSTPAIDTSTGILYAVGFVGGATAQYQLFGLNVADGTPAFSAVPLTPSGLDVTVQNQRAALALANGHVYVAFGGWLGDCGNYHPWVVSVNTTTRVLDHVYQPQVGSQRGAGIWEASGPSVDGAGNVYVETGNGFEANCSNPWDHGDGVIKLSATLSEVAWFAPNNGTQSWCNLNGADADMGSIGPVLLPGGRAFAAGKSGYGWLLNQSLGGFNAFLWQGHIGFCGSSDAIFGGFAYRAPYVYVPCSGRGIQAVNVSSTAVAMGWQAGGFNPGPPIVVGDVVWSLDINGSGLYGIDASSGAVLAHVGLPQGVNHFATPSEDGGLVFVPLASGVAAVDITGFRLGGNLIYGPDAASRGSNRLDVFAVGSDAQMYHRWFDGGQWNGWEAQKGVFQSSPASVSWGADRLDVFGRGADGALWHEWWDGARWNGWEPLGGALGSGPDVASWGLNRLDVFVRGTDGQLWHKWWDGAAWSPWESLGGVLTSDPTAVSWGANLLDVFVRGADNQLWHRWFDGGAWGAWEPLGGQLTSGPDASSWGANRLDVFARGGDNGIWHRWWDTGHWYGWEPQGGVATSDPGAVSWGPNRIDVFVTGADSALWHEWWDGIRWNVWTDS